MKKVLCAHDCGRFKAGSIYKAEESPINAAMIRIYQSDDEFIPFGKNDPFFKEVETFERGGEEWIKNPGEMIIPERWVVDLLTSKGRILCYRRVSSTWNWGDCEESIRGFQVIDPIRSAKRPGPEEKPAPKAEVHALSPQQFGALPDSDLGRERKRLLRQSHSLFSELVWLEGEIEGFRKFTPDDAMKDRDERPPSPQEAAFAAKHPEPEKPKPLAFPDVKLNDNFSCHVGGKWG